MALFYIFANLINGKLSRRRLGPTPAFYLFDIHQAASAMSALMREQVEKANYVLVLL